MLVRHCWRSSGDELGQFIRHRSRLEGQRLVEEYTFARSFASWSCSLRRRACMRRERGESIPDTPVTARGARLW